MADAASVASATGSAASKFERDFMFGSGLNALLIFRPGAIAFQAPSTGGRDNLRRGLEGRRPPKAAKPKGAASRPLAPEFDNVSVSFPLDRMSCRLLMLALPRCKPLSPREIV